MSREASNPSALSQGSGSNSAGAFSQTGAGTGFNIASGSAPFEDQSRPVNYLCGECDTKVMLKKNDPIRCKECGYRVLYKERTNRMIQFEAR